MRQRNPETMKILTLKRFPSDRRHDVVQSAKRNYLKFMQHNYYYKSRNFTETLRVFVDRIVC